MFAVVGLTLEQISSGSLPQIHLANALDIRVARGSDPSAPMHKILVYTTEGTDTQALVARTKYKEQGQFLLFLYFNDVAVDACHDLGIPLHILDRIQERELPPRRTTIIDRPYVSGRVPHHVSRP